MSCVSCFYCILTIHALALLYMCSYYRSAWRCWVEGSSSRLTSLPLPSDVRPCCGRPSLNSTAITSVFHYLTGCIRHGIIHTLRCWNDLLLSTVKNWNNMDFSFPQLDWLYSFSRYSHYQHNICPQYLPESCTGLSFQPRPDSWAFIIFIDSSAVLTRLGSLALNIFSTQRMQGSSR